MAGGWARDGAVQDQIDDTVNDAVKAARSRLPAPTPGGESAQFCGDCGDDIPEKRRIALPGVTTCVACQSDRDQTVRHSAFNRRGSKDSQLR
ncbi:DksA/TraR family C4-type zinc finger protein [Altererythrobacter aquiaggeris]|uniref:DksA/TraR family C4-type zinc finger protein n=1 Tax=Aestuarierythrobacter aquiaggeris TaxID=1898396 RepID=UPI0030188F6E